MTVSGVLLQLTMLVIVAWAAAYFGANRPRFLSWAKIIIAAVPLAVFVPMAIAGTGWLRGETLGEGWLLLTAITYYGLMAFPGTAVCVGLILGTALAMIRAGSLERS